MNTWKRHDLRYTGGIIASRQMSDDPSDVLRVSWTDGSAINYVAEYGGEIEGGATMSDALRAISARCGLPPIPPPRGY